MSPVLLVVLIKTAVPRIDRLFGVDHTVVKSPKVHLVVAKAVVHFLEPFPLDPVALRAFVEWVAVRSKYVEVLGGYTQFRRLLLQPYVRVELLFIVRRAVVAIHSHLLRSRHQQQTAREHPRQQENAERVPGSHLDNPFRTTVGTADKLALVEEAPARLLGADDHGPGEGESARARAALEGMRTTTDATTRIEPAGGVAPTGSLIATTR